MRAPTTRQAATPAPTARAAGCMAGLAALVLSLAAWSDLGAGGADTRQSIGERRSLDAEYYLGADPNIQRGSKSGGG